MLREADGMLFPPFLDLQWSVWAPVFNWKLPTPHSLALALKYSSHSKVSYQPRWERWGEEVASKSVYLTMDAPWGVSVPVVSAVKGPVWSKCCVRKQAKTPIFVSCDHYDPAISPSPILPEVWDSVQFDDNDLSLEGDLGLIPRTLLVSEIIPAARPFGQLPLMSRVHVLGAFLNPCWKR